MGRFSTFGNDLYSGRRSIDFVGRRKTWYLIAALIVVLCLGTLLVRGLNPGIEFRGGSEFRLSGVASADELAGTAAVSKIVPHTEVRVSTVGGDSVRVQTEKLTDEQTDAVREALAQAYDVPDANITSSFVGPSWGNDISRKAIQGLVVFIALVALVITLYFRTWKMAVAGLVALVFDLIVTIGVYALIGFEVTPASVIGFLTILGYSLYDTVVVFDKVRENTDHITATTKYTYAEAANLAVNQTLVRSINTSVVALLPVGSILFIGAFLLGAGTLKDLSLALFVGIAAGTGSSIFIATPLLVDLRMREPELVAQAERVRRRRAGAAVREEAAVGAAARGPARPATSTEDDAAGTGDAAPDDATPAPAPSGRGSTRRRPAGAAPASAGGQRRQPRSGSSRSRKGRR